MMDELTWWGRALRAGPSQEPERQRKPLSWARIAGGAGELHAGGNVGKLILRV
jgi:hypothetical protein